MYSVILLTAMTTTAPEAPSFGGLFRRCNPCVIQCCPIPVCPPIHHNCCGCIGTCISPHCCGGCISHHCCGCIGHCYGGCCGGCYGGCCGGCYGGYICPPPPPPPCCWPNCYHPHHYGNQQGGGFTAYNFQNAKPQPATLVLKVPEGAEVVVDGYKTKSTGSLREMTTPELQPGKQYFYEVKVIIKRNGTTMEDTQRIALRAGQSSKAEFVEGPTSVTMAER